MINPFGVRDKLAIIVIVALSGMLLMATIWGAKQSIKLSDERAAHATSKAAFEAERASAALLLASAEKKARDIERRWSRHAQEIADGTQIALDEARKRGAAAATAGDRLREQIAALSACPAGVGTASPATAAASSSARATADLLANVRRRLDEAEEATFRFADAAHIAGSACERTYDALTTKPNS